MVAEQLRATLKRMPMLSESKPLGMRAEHWYEFNKHVGEIDVFRKVIAQLAAGDVPDSVL